MMNRRNLLQGMAAGAGAALSSTLFPEVSRAAALVRGAPKRVIFFLQNQGFDPATAIPEGLEESCSLSGVTLPDPVSPLEEIKDMIQIVKGLHGTHTSPSHSAYFGALGGYRGGIGIPARGATIDHIISQELPETILPHLCIGMDSLPNMKSRPTLATLSATGPDQPIFMHSNPNDLYELLFGGLASGDVKKRYEARSKVFDKIEKLVSAGGKGVPMGSRGRYERYVDGFKEINGLRERLAGVSDHLVKFAPEYDDGYTSPEFETDWHDRLLDIGLASLKSGITNTLTIGSGRGEIFGAWKGLGFEEQGHNLGHMPQPDNPIWVKIRQYNSRMLVKMVRELESMPEGDGTMMDNTLIVYTSNNADKQHTNGAQWPFILIGNDNSPVKTGEFTQLEESRPINDLYTTLLHTVGVEQDRFNLDEKTAERTGSKNGPVEDLLA